MIPSGRDLKDMLVDLYGARDWLRRGAQEIGVSTRTLKKWTSGERKPTIRNCGRIKRAVARQQDRIALYVEQCGL